MRFLVDECCGPVVAKWLREQGYDVCSVAEELFGVDDDVIITKAWDETRIIVTSDKDFGEKVYRERRTHHGILLLRLEDERPHNALFVLRNALKQLGQSVQDRFVVVTETRIRIAGEPGSPRPRI